MLPSDRSPPRSGPRALAAAITVSTSGNLPAFVVGAVAVQLIAALGIDNTRLGLAVGAFFGIAIIASVPAGRLVDRIGWARGTTVVALLSIGSLLGTAIVASSFVGVLLMLLVGGLAFAGTTPAANLAIAQELPVERHGLVFGIKQGAIPLGTTIAGLLVPAVALTVGWRWTFVVAAVFPLVALAVALPGVNHRAPVPPRPVPRRRQGRAPRPQQTGLIELRWLAVAGALTAHSIGALNGFAVVTLVASGRSPGSAGMMVAVAGMIAASVRVVSGWLIDRSTGDGFRGVVVLNLIGAFGYLAMATGTPTLVTIGVLVAFGAGWGWPGLFHYGLVRLFPGRPGYATGVIQTGFATGTAVGPVIFGVIADASGYVAAWLLSTVVTAGSAAMIALTVRRLRAVLRTQPPVDP